MKTKIIYLLLGAVLIAPSCNDYLKEDSGDLLIPNTVSEFQALLYGSGYGRDFNREAQWIKIMTDDVETNVLRLSVGESTENEGYWTYLVGKAEFAYQWALDLEENITDRFWSGRYSDILTCNLVIQSLPDIDYTESETGKYNYLAAQAYALRAYHFFCLVNTYALPYSTENLDKPGVVLRLDPEVSTDNMSQPRATIRQVYEQINSDLEKAQEYMDGATQSANKHLISDRALKLLRTRVALFQENWDEVIETGSEFFRETKYIYDLNSVDIADLGLDAYDVDNGEPFCITAPSNEEVIFTFSDESSAYDYLSKSGGNGRLGYRTSYSRRSSLIHAYRMTNVTPYDDSEDNIVLYDDYNYEHDEDIIDLRHRAFFKRNKAGKPIAADSSFRCYYPIKYQDVSNGYCENWRTVEVFLNVAEAYARKATGVSADAVSLLNDLRVKRVRAEHYTALTVADFASKEQLLKFIWQERRRELCFEEIMRFWDLRRQGMPSLTHYYYTTMTSYSVFVLPEKSNNWVMKIPASESSNTAIVDNPRDMIDPQSSL